MFLRCKVRRKDGKQHRYWSVVENTRVAGGRVVQRHVLYLGEINDTQELAWRRSIAVLEDGAAQPRTLSLFPEDRCEGLLADSSTVRVKLSELRLRRPRQWGACWLALLLWRELQLDLFWSKRLGSSRKGTRWDQVLFVLAAYRLLAPGSEWRLHREWFQRSALADLLGEDAGLAEIHKLYRCHDRLLTHKQAVFDHLVGRWRDLFNISYDVLLYDLTSTYFEADPPFPEGDKRRYGYSRDHRPDCVQIVIALVVTPEGLPLAYEVLPGNTSDKTTLRPFLERIERQYGKARRVWLMDRGVHAAMHPGAQINQSLRSFDQGRQNVGREHIDCKDARNSGLHFHPPLAITDARIVDYSVEAAELVDLAGNRSWPSDGGEVPEDNSASAGCRREGVATSPLVSPMQYDIMALVDQGGGPP